MSQWRAIAVVLLLAFGLYGGGLLTGYGLRVMREQQEQVEKVRAVQVPLGSSADSRLGISVCMLFGGTTCELHVDSSAPSFVNECHFSMYDASGGLMWDFVWRMDPAECRFDSKAFIDQWADWTLSGRPASSVRLSAPDRDAHGLRQRNHGDGGTMLRRIKDGLFILMLLAYLGEQYMWKGVEAVRSRVSCRGAASGD